MLVENVELAIVESVFSQGVSFFIFAQVRNPGVEETIFV